MAFKTFLSCLVASFLCLQVAGFVPVISRRGPSGVSVGRTARKGQVLNMSLNPLAGLALSTSLAFNMAPVDMTMPTTTAASSIITTTSTTLIADKEVRQGLYGEYTVDKTEQKYENAAGTFKTKDATEANKNKYISILTVLLIGSAVIPMVQYWWYVKDEEQVD